MTLSLAMAMAIAMAMAMAMAMANEILCPYGHFNGWITIGE